MTNIVIVAVGNVKEDYYREAIAEYAKRISRYAVLTVKEIKEERIDEDSAGDAAVNAALDKEGKAILTVIDGLKSPCVTALCVEGKKLSSPAFAGLIEKASANGTAVFVIGSSHGLSDEVKRRAANSLSFSDMTFPHRLMRVILCEQLYRGLSILGGGRYHK